MSKCKRCKNTRASKGFDNQPRLWCASCAHTEYQAQGIAEERRCDSHKKCERCHTVGASYGFDVDPRIWCRLCAHTEYEFQGIAEDRRCDTMKKCDRCKKARPNYGYDGEPWIWCRPCAHTEYEAQGIVEERRCDANKKCSRCKKARPSYGFDGQCRLWCRPCAHTEYKAQDITEERRCDAHKKCAFVFGDGTQCPIVTNNKEHDRCVRHDTSKKRRRKTKEMAVVDHLLHHDHKEGMRYNVRETVECSADASRPTRECSAERCAVSSERCSTVSQKYYFPDITWDRGNYIKHLEVDEQQHKSYSCECKRVMSLAQSRYEVATLLIRYNPDAMHVDGTNWRWKQKDRLQLLDRVLEWADGEEAQREACEAWRHGQVLVIYLFYDDKFCKDEEGAWPGQVCLLGVDTHSKNSTTYYETQHRIPTLYAKV